MAVLLAAPCSPRCRHEHRLWAHRGVGQWRGGFLLARSWGDVLPAASQPLMGDQELGGAVLGVGVLTGREQRQAFVLPSSGHWCSKGEGEEQGHGTPLLREGVVGGSAVRPGPASRCKDVTGPGSSGAGA